MEACAGSVHNWFQQAINLELNSAALALVRTSSKYRTRKVGFRIRYPQVSACRLDGGWSMSTKKEDPVVPDDAARTLDIVTEVRREEALLKTGALQNAIFNSANFSSIATDEKGVIQLFNVGAERMLGYAAAEVLNKITPADISDPQEVIARAGLRISTS
jgi:PAS domain-containing protein